MVACFYSILKRRIFCKRIFTLNVCLVAAQHHFVIVFKELFSAEKLYNFLIQQPKYSSHTVLTILKHITQNLLLTNKYFYFLFSCSSFFPSTNAFFARVSGIWKKVLLRFKKKMLILLSYVIKKKIIYNFRNCCCCVIRRNLKKCSSTFILLFFSFFFFLW